MEYINFNNYMGAAINCDAYDFLNASIKPSLLLENHYKRQARPAYILIGSGLGYSIHTLLTPIHQYLYKYLSLHFSNKYDTRQLKKATLYGSHYIGYILFNLITMLFSALLFEKCLLQISGLKKISTPVLCASLLFLCSNYVSKAFFWTVHQQLFSILCPLLCIYIGLNRYKLFKSNFEVFLISTICGLLLLFYGSFLLVLPTIIYSIYLENRKESLGIKSFIGRSLLSTVSFFMPYIIWIIVLKLINVDFYNYESEQYREIVWIIDTLGISPTVFLDTLIQNLNKFILTFRYLLVFTVILFLPLSIKVINSIYNRDLQNIKDSKILLFVFLIFLSFFGLLGYYVPRLTFSLATPLLLYFVGMFILNQKIKTALSNSTLLLLSIGWHVYNVFSYGPFS